MRRIPVTFLMTFGHCGLDWLHSLLDSHKQILIMPALSFYRCWKKLGLSSVNNHDEMFNLWFEYISLHIGPTSKNEQKKFLHSQNELDRFFIKFKQLLIINGIKRADVFWAIHEAYAYAKKINIDDKIVLVSHEHQPWPYDLIHSDFKESNLLMIIRDPRASIAGAYNGTIVDFSFLQDYVVNVMTEEWLQGIGILNKYGDVLGKRLKVVRNEAIHDDHEKQMRNISEWLNIDFSNTMMCGTFSTGKRALPDTRYLKRGENPDDTFYLKKNIKKRWMNVLSKRDILMIEGLFGEIMKKHNYNFIYKRTIVSSFIGHYIFLMPHPSVMKRWLEEYPKLEVFGKIESRLLLSQRRLLYEIWKLVPAAIKLLVVICHSVIRRIIILYFFGDRWKRYDQNKIRLD